MNLANKLLGKSRSLALIDSSESLTYGQLSDMSMRLAYGLQKDKKIESGNHVVIIANNSIEFVVAYLAILICGAVAIPLDPHQGETESARDISLVKPKLIITSSTEIIPRTYRDVIDSIEFHSPQWREYLRGKNAEIVQCDKHDVAVMMMTSTSSFQPRPAMLTHGSLIANLEQAKAATNISITEKDKVLCALPLYHIFGLHVVLDLSLYQGAEVVIVKRFDPIEIANTIEQNKITIVPGVPVLFDSFINNPQITIDSFSSVQLFISGGAPMRSELIENFKHTFGTNLAEGYGLTEASPMVAFNSEVSIEGDIGTALPGIDIEVRDSTGEVALPGDVGQIVVHGENIFAGYYGEKEATAKALDPNGWLYTGDIGIRDDEGRIKLIDRANDVIVVNGFSVFPSEVEKVLLDCDTVSKAAVVGELDENTGESVIAYIQAHQIQAIDDPRIKRQLEKGLRDHCSAYLAKYKIPTKFEFIDELNLSASSRPLRKSLRSAIGNID